MLVALKGKMYFETRNRIESRIKVRGSVLWCIFCSLHTDDASSLSHIREEEEEEQSDDEKAKPVEGGLLLATTTTATPLTSFPFYLVSFYCLLYRSSFVKPSFFFCCWGLVVRRTSKRTRTRTRT